MNRWRPSFMTALGIRLPGLLVRVLTGTPLLWYLPACDLTHSPDPSEVQPSALPTPPPSASLADASCSNGRVVTVSRVVDGDTLELTVLNADGELEDVRLVGIDTPEVYGEGGPECYGPEHSGAADARVDDAVVCLTYDPAVEAQSGNVDYYGRTLGYMFYGLGFEHFLNADLLIGGYAEDYPFTDGAVFARYFYDLEAYAKAENVGRWSACPDSEKH